MPWIPVTRTCPACSAGISVTNTHDLYNYARATQDHQKAQSCWTCGGSRVITTMVKVY